MFKKAIKMIKGYLTQKDMELLRQASARQLKHKKVFPKKFSCASCSYTWFYQSLKCPSCTSATIRQMA
ncbi:MAG: hypothetical protein HYY37_00135 [Candidatus Aenigmarchaeota archaeon]|nr:hypothetical protein [Candidatus Aenigmarchaeota archaeon]